MLLRIEKLNRKGVNTELHEEMLKVYCYDSAETISAAGKEALLAFGTGDELRMTLMGLRRFTKTEPFNVKESRRKVAATVIEANRYGL
jgi:hypothetical protein